MPFSVSFDPPNPLILRSRTSWLPDYCSEISFSLRDENHLTTGYLTTGTFINIGRYEIIEVLGKGSFGAVCRAKDVYNGGADRAIKFHNFSGDALNEMHNYNLFYQKPDFTKVPMVEQFFRIFHNGVPYICASMEMLSHSLYRAIHHGTVFPYPFATLVMRNVLEGFRYLHEVVGIAHLDVSPANIAFKDPFELKQYNLPASPHIRIIDFNTSQPPNKIKNCTRYIPGFRAPEVCMNIGYTNSADIFAVGAVAFFMVKGFDFFPAYETVTNEELIYAMLRSFGEFPARILNAAPFGLPFVRIRGVADSVFHFSDKVQQNDYPPRYLKTYFKDDGTTSDATDWHNLVQSMFNLDMFDRPTASDLLANSPLFTRYPDPAPEPQPSVPAHPFATTPQVPDIPDWVKGPFPNFISDHFAVDTPRKIRLPISQYLNKQVEEQAQIAAANAANVLVDSENDISFHVRTDLVVAPIDSNGIVDQAMSSNGPVGSAVATHTVSSAAQEYDVDDLEDLEETEPMNSDYTTQSTDHATNVAPVADPSIGTHAFFSVSHVVPQFTQVYGASVPDFSFAYSFSSNFLVAHQPFYFQSAYRTNQTDFTNVPVDQSISGPSVSPPIDSTVPPQYYQPTVYTQTDATNPVDAQPITDNTAPAASPPIDSTVPAQSFYSQPPAQPANVAYQPTPTYNPNNFAPIQCGPLFRDVVTEQMINSIQPMPARVGDYQAAYAESMMTHDCYASNCYIPVYTAPTFPTPSISMDSVPTNDDSAP